MNMIDFSITVGAEKNCPDKYYIIYRIMAL